MSNAFKRGVMKRKNEMAIRGKVFRPVIRMSRIHELKLLEPRGLVNFEYAIWPEPACSKRVTIEGFIIGWAEHVSVRAPKEDKRTGFTLGVFIDEANG